MHLSVLLSFSVTLFGLASAIPGPKLGAAYTMTNKAANTLIVSSIGPDGTLSFSQEIATGGAGTPVNKADPLGSQNSIIATSGVNTFLSRF